MFLRTPDVPPECTGDLARADRPWGPRGRMPGTFLTHAAVRLRAGGSEGLRADAVVLESVWEGSEGWACPDAVRSPCLAEWGSTLSFLRVLRSGGAIWEWGGSCWSVTGPWPTLSPFPADGASSELLHNLGDPGPSPCGKPPALTSPSALHPQGSSGGEKTLQVLPRPPPH